MSEKISERRGTATTTYNFIMSKHDWSCWSAGSHAKSSELALSHVRCKCG